MSNLITRFALAALVAVIVILAATGNLISTAPLVISVQALAIALSIWARRSFPRGTFRVAADPAADALIQRGPYRVLRHPMYAAALLFVWAAVLSHRSVLTWTLGLVLTVIVAARVVGEERILRARYDGYDAYARSTKALIPFVL